jgi:endonuclease-8
VPEGDTIAYAAHRMRRVLRGRVPDSIRTPHPRHALSRWPERLAGRAVTDVDTHGKHLFVRFEGGLALHSHLGMRGVWGVYGQGRRWGRSPARAWLVLSAAGHDVVEFDGPLLELLTESRLRFDRRLASLGPDVLAEQFAEREFLRRLRGDDPGRAIGDALLDQRTVAGIGNVWKAEGCWQAALSPWRTIRTVSDSEALAIIAAIRPRMQRSAREGPRAIEPRVYGRSGQPCPRCGARVRARGQGDADRTTYWCPACQS